MEYSDKTQFNPQFEGKHLALTPEPTLPNQPKLDFKIIWHDLTHRVDSRPWYTKIKDKLYRSNQDVSNIEEAGGRNNHGEKTILQRVCGDVKSGELTGILGPSGAGKSTLLHCLFQNRSAGTTGRILVDSPSKKRLKVCFIPQNDYLNEWLTVREDLIFVSKLKSARFSGFLGDNLNSTLNTDAGEIIESPVYVRQNGTDSCNTSVIDHDANAVRVAELLGLTGCLDVYIKNISGGQRKRLSIARELMSKPNILILDEPTTGLDSLTCLKTMQVLRELVRQSTQPLAVVITIHQPPHAVFELMDKAYFISNRGQVVYHGTPRDVTKTLDLAAQYKSSTPNYNQASTLIEISSSPTKYHIVDKLAAYHRTQFAEKYDSGYLKKLMRLKIPSWYQGFHNNTTSTTNGTTAQNNDNLDAFTSVKSLEAPNPTIADSVSADRSSSSSTMKDDEYFISYHLADCISSHSNSLIQSFKHIFILTHRSWLSNIRNPSLTRSRFVFHAALPLIMLMIFGTHSGRPNNCPTINSELNIADMRKNMDDGVIKKNVDDFRLAIENISFYFILMYGFGINIISLTASHYPLTIHMFKKETINGLYTAGPYLIGQTLAEIPLEIFFPSISVIIGYSLSGQISSYMEWRMFSTVLMVLLVCYCVHSLGLLFGSIFINDVKVAVLLGQVALFPAVMFSGFLVRTERMPTWMYNLSMFSFFKHALFGVVAARYGFNVCECDESMLPEEGEPVGFQGLPPNIKHVLDYMFPKNDTDEVAISEVFDKLSERFTKTQTFAQNITTCDDVKPFAMTAFSVEDYHLYSGAIALLIMIIVIKLVTFTIVRLSPYRTN